MSRPESVIHFASGMDRKPDWAIIRSLFRFGLPTGVQGIAMNVAGVLLLRFIGSLPESAAAQAAYAVGYTELFSLITWTSVGLMGAAATIAGQNLGAGNPERSLDGVRVAARIGLGMAAVIGAMFVVMPRLLLGAFGMTDMVVLSLGEELLRYLSVSGLFITVALAYTGGLQGTGDTRSPLYISIVSQIVIPLGICAVLQATRGLSAPEIWLAIVIGHFTRCLLSVTRFRQQKWRHIAVDIEPARPLSDERLGSEFLIPRRAVAARGMVSDELVKIVATRWSARAGRNVSRRARRQAAKLEVGSWKLSVQSSVVKHSAFAGLRKVPPPENEPNYGYLPGSRERAELKERLAQMAGERIDIPIIIGGCEIRTGTRRAGGHAPQPPARPRALACGRCRARSTGDRAPRRRRAATGVAGRGRIAPPCSCAPRSC